MARKRGLRGDASSAEDSPQEELLQEIEILQRRISELQQIPVKSIEDDPIRSLRVAVETMQLGVTITDVRGNILYTNPAEARIHGYTVEELTGQEVRLLAPKESW